jgi:hypothetical protein
VHPDFLEHADRSKVVLQYETDDSRQLKLRETELQARERRLGRQPPAPIFGKESITHVDLVKVIEILQACETDDARLRFINGGPTPVPGLGEIWIRSDGERTPFQANSTWY